MFREKYRLGKALREKTTRRAHAGWQAPPDRPPVEEMMEKSNIGRLPELIPIRHFRMSRSPFAFYRATAQLMARDLSSTPRSGIIVQACGDCHLMNFGGFATPERTLIVDINDFDETSAAPWEWDLKRLAVSFLLACREKGFGESDGRDVIMQLLSSYQEKILAYATMNFLDLWYSKLTFEEVGRDAATKEGRSRVIEAVRKANKQTHDSIFYKITVSTLGKIEITDQRPLIYHPVDVKAHMKEIESFMDQYKGTLQNDRKQLLDHYHVVDVALKVVGVGSVGTRCLVVLLMNDNKEPLFLQVKEAGASVLESFAGGSRFTHSGERVVQGQRLIQSASDMFLGWASASDGRQYYLRQLRDKKISPQIEHFSKRFLGGYAAICGNILARAHCKTGQGPLISGYIGKGAVFNEAVLKFVLAYADQTEKDYNVFMQAVKAGKLAVSAEAPKDL